MAIRLFSSLPRAQVNGAGILAHRAVDDGDVFFSHGPVFPQLAQFAGGGGVLGHDGNAAGFAVEAVDQAGFCAQIEARAADQAGKLAVLGGMANQAGGFVDDQQVGVLVENVEQGRGIAEGGRSGGVMEWWSAGRPKTPSLQHSVGIAIDCSASFAIGTEKKSLVLP